MTEEIKTDTGEKILPVIRRPFMLSIFAVSAFTFCFTLFILFTLSLCYTGSITRVTNSYVPEKPVATSTLLFIFLGGSLLHAAACAGIFMIWHMRRSGYILFSSSSLIITLYQLTLSSVSLLNTGIYVLFIIIFGVFIKNLK